MKIVNKLTAISLCTLLFAACGGGGGDPAPAGGGGGGPIGTPGGGGTTTDLSSLTNDNAGLIAFVAMSNTKSYATALQTQGGTELLLAGFTLVDAQLKGLGNSGTRACDKEGMKTWAFTDNDGDTYLSTGDTWSFDQINCTDTDTYADGTWVINFIEHNPDNSVIARHDEMEFITDLYGTSFGSDYTFRGTYNLSITTPDNVVSTIVVSSDNIITATNGEPDSTLKNFMVSMVKDDASLAETLEFKGDISDASLGHYIVATQAPLNGVDIPLLGGDQMYFAGEFTVTLDTGKVKLFVLDASNVRISVDIEGDGLYETSFDTTWSDLTVKYMSFIGFNPFPDGVFPM